MFIWSNVFKGSFFFVLKLKFTIMTGIFFIEHDKVKGSLQMAYAYCVLFPDLFSWTSSKYLVLMSVSSTATKKKQLYWKDDVDSSHGVQL